MMNKLRSSTQVEARIGKKFPRIFSLIFVWVPGLSILNQALLFQCIFPFHENIYFINRKGNELE